MLRVAVYDGSPIFLNGLQKFVKDTVDIKVVESFTAVTETLPWLVDVFLVDVDITGAELLGAFTTRLAALAPVLAMAHASIARPAVEAVITAGASGVVDRRISPQGLMDAIRTVGSGDTFVAPVFEVEPSILERQELRELSGREQQVLEMIARGLTHHQIARSMRISRHTVDTYVKRIRSKLNLGNKAELTRVAILRSIAT